MKKFEVSVEECRYGVVTVEADSPEEAIAKLQARIDAGEDIEMEKDESYGLELVEGADPVEVEE